MDVESFHSDTQPHMVQYLKSNTLTIQDQHPDLIAPREATLYNSTVQSKSHPKRHPLITQSQQLKSQNSLQTSDMYKIIKNYERDKIIENLEESESERNVKFKEFSNQDQNNDSDYHQNSNESLYSHKNFHNQLKKLTSLTQSQKDYYVTDGEKTIQSKEDHLERLLGIILMNNKFKQKQKNLNDSFEKRKQAFKSLLSAPMQLHILKRMNTKRSDSKKLFQLVNPANMSAKEEEKVYKLYKRAQTLNNFKISIQSMKELYNNPDLNLVKMASAFHQGQTPAQQRWGKLRKVLITIIKMRHLEIKKLEEASDIISEIRKFPLKKASKAIEQQQRVTDNPIDENRRVNMYFSAIAFGGSKGLERVKKMLDQDPKQHIRDTTSKLHMVNNKNYLGMTPLYVACMNGHLDIVEYLIQRGADPYLPSKFENSKKEKIIVVSARWNHQKIIKYLLEKYSWKEKDIKQALRETNPHSECYRLLMIYSRQHFGKLKTACCLGGLFK